MRNFLWFIIGVLFGVLIMLMRDDSVDFFDSSDQMESPTEVNVDMEFESIKGLTFFDEAAADMMSVKYLRVSSVLPNGYAIADECGYDDFLVTTGLEVLLLPSMGEHFYDRQPIEIGRDNVILRVGEYRKNQNTLMPAITIVKR